MRGLRSSGYGFVALATEEAALKAVETLDKKELDGRSVIVEIAKPSDQKDKEKRGKKFKRRPGRRGGKAVPGEVTEAEADGEPSKEDGAVTAPESTEAAKPKKKKFNVCSPRSTITSCPYSFTYFSARRDQQLPLPPKVTPLAKLLRLKRSLLKVLSGSLV